MVWLVITMKFAMVVNRFARNIWITRSSSGWRKASRKAHRYSSGLMREIAPKGALEVIRQARVVARHTSRTEAGGVVGDGTDGRIDDMIKSASTA